MTRVLAAMAFVFAAGIAAVPLAHAQDTATPVSAPAITVTPVVTRTLEDIVVASGTIEPVELVTIAPQIEGQQIEQLFVDVGDRVEAGDLLVRLGDDILQIEKEQLAASRVSADVNISQADAVLTEARSTADEAVRVRDRAEKLRADGTVSQAAFDQVRSAADSALARVTASEQGLAAARAQLMLVDTQIANIDLRLVRTKIVAPVSGIVSQRNARVGAIASAAGQPMFVLIRDGLLNLEADVAEADLLRLSVGQPVSLRSIGVADRLTGSVRLIEPTIDATTRLGRARIALDKPELVRPGLFAEADILVARREGLAVPLTAVSTSADGATSVMRVGDDGVVERLDVTTGIRDGGAIEILTGLSAGDMLVARAGAFVRPGDRINPVPEDAAPVVQSN